MNSVLFLSLALNRAWDRCDLQDVQQQPAGVGLQEPVSLFDQVSRIENYPDVNEQPVIGILTMPVDETLKDDKRFDNYTSIVVGANVRYIQSMGARVVPLVMDDPWETNLDKLSKINGLLYPGGNSDYFEFGKKVFEEVKRRNDEGEFFPVYGICMGHEYFTRYTASDPDSVLSDIFLNFISIPIQFEEGYELKNSMVYSDLPAADKAVFEAKNITWHSHMYSVRPKTVLEDPKLNSFWQITSRSKMPDMGEEVIASMEAQDYPFFTTQFHPEKPQSFYQEGIGINRSWESIRVQRRFASKLVKMSRQNKNSFGSFEESLPFMIEHSPLVNVDFYWGDVYVF